jgi:hypothetical protein
MLLKITYYANGVIMQGKDSNTFPYQDWIFEDTFLGVGDKCKYHLVIAA